jgi:hypothetical protein
MEQKDFLKNILALSAQCKLSSIKNYTDSVKYHINGMPDVAHIVKKLARNITENTDRGPDH